MSARHKYPSQIISQQAAEIRRITAELDDLKRTLNIPPDARAAFGLGIKSNLLFSLLMNRELVSRDAAMSALYGAQTSDAPLEKTIEVLISLMRRKLPAGTEIKNEFQRGWYIPRDHKARIRELLNQGDDHEPRDKRLGAAVSPPPRPSAATA